MALVKCPECGRENVSDSAESCPNCGFGIKVHFNKVKENKIQQRRLDSIPMPQKPEKEKIGVKGWFAILLFPSLFALFALIGFVAGEIGGAMIMICVGAFLFYIIYYATVLQEYNKKMEKYNRAIQDFEKYKRDEIKEQNIKYAEQVKIAEAKKNNQPICPKCGSTDVADGTRGYTLTTGFVGSGNFRYICKKCNFKWKPGGWNEALQRDINKKY